MLKNTVFVLLLIAALLLIFAVGDARSANNVTLTKLKNIPDSQIASCTVKSNDFKFLCLLNTKNYYSCKFLFGTAFTLPTCKKCADDKVKPEVKPEVKPKVSNPLLDLLNNKAKEY